MCQHFYLGYACKIQTCKNMQGNGVINRAAMHWLVYDINSYMIWCQYPCIFGAAFSHTLTEYAPVCPIMITNRVLMCVDTDKQVQDIHAHTNAIYYELGTRHCDTVYIGGQSNVIRVNLFFSVNFFWPEEVTLTDWTRNVVRVTTPSK